MCSPSVKGFINYAVKKEEIEGKRVLEVGSLDVNGSPRDEVTVYCPAQYIGTDVVPGRGVDEICSVYDLVEKFGKDSFDAVICTEVLEHVLDWKKAVHNLKNIIKPDGLLILTTRSEGFMYHPFPFDAWRFELADMASIFNDLNIHMLQTDPASPGVFIKAKKPFLFIEKDLKDYKAFSVIANMKVGFLDIYVEL